MVNKGRDDNYSWLVDRYHSKWKTPNETLYQSWLGIPSCVNFFFFSSLFCTCPSLRVLERDRIIKYLTKTPGDHNKPFLENIFYRPVELDHHECFKWCELRFRSVFTIITNLKQKCCRDLYYWYTKTAITTSPQSCSWINYSNRELLLPLGFIQFQVKVCSKGFSNFIICTILHISSRKRWKS